MSTSPAESDANRWPPQIKYIVGNEAAERFSYYGMRSILALYITTALLQTKDRATTIIHLFGFVNYFMPLIGAYISDRLWGRYKTILWISLFYCLGHGVLATSDLFTSIDGKLICLYTGLGLIAFGSGGIKPCVSAFMGDQFAPNQGHLMRKAYGAFYFSINFGSFFSFLIIPWIASKKEPLAASAGFFDRFCLGLKEAGFTGYSWAFAVPGILMALATLVFWLGTKHYVRKPPARETRSAGFFSVFFAAWKHSGSTGSKLQWPATVSLLTSFILPVAAMAGMFFLAVQEHPGTFAKAVGWAGVGSLGLLYLLLLLASATNALELPLAYWQGARSRFSDSEISAARSVAPIIAVFAFVPLFWSLFDQSNSTWVLQGAQMKPFSLMGFKIDAEQMQSLNPLLVMIMVPFLNWILYPLLEKLGFQPTSLRRISAGLLLTAGSFFIVAWLQQRIESREIVSLAWQAVSYIVLTAGEVLVSTTGLEFAYTQASPSMKSTVMSLWLVTVAMGNLIVTSVTQLGGGHGMDSVSANRFYLYAKLTLVVSGLFVAVAARYRYRENELEASRG